MILSFVPKRQSTALVSGGDIDHPITMLEIVGMLGLSG